MSNFICHICEINKVYKDYKGTELLDSEGSKPCFDCLIEFENSKEEQEKEIEL